MTFAQIDTQIDAHGPGCAHEHAPPAGKPAKPSLRMVATRSSAGTLLAVLAGVTVWVVARNPLKSTVFPPCPLHASTGIWCPGCGATRASYLMLHGDLVSAMHFNAMWVVLAPFVAYQVVAFAAEAHGVRWLRRIPMTQPVIAALLVAIVGFAVVRNLPFEAFEVLNPVTAS
jgi:hypothetical protein